MFIQRRFGFLSMLKWTRREIIFFTVYVSIITTLYEVFNLTWIQIPFTPIGLVGTAVAFLVGFQNNAAYDRIWEARKIWGGIVNTSRTLIITVKDSFYLHTPAVKKDEKENIKIITDRHIAWLTALRYAMRASKPWEANYDKMHKDLSFTYIVPEFQTSLEEELKPYLSDKEFAQVMKADNKPNAIIDLQSKHLRELTDEDKIWNFTYLNLQGILQELTALQGKSERIKNFPYPKQYASISYHFVHVFMWLLPLGIIPTFSALEAPVSIHNPIIGAYFVWLSIPLTVIVIWVFNTMLRIGLAGENPFEGSPNDVPISTIARGITRDILQIIEEDPDNIPPAFDSINHIQM
jgi:putative membrane protein